MNKKIDKPIETKVEKTDSNLLVLFCLILLSSTFVFSRQMLDPILPIRFLYLSIGVVIVFLFIKNKATFTEKLTHNKAIKTYTILSLMFFVWQTISSFWAINYSLCIEYIMPQILYFVVVLLLIYFIDSKEKIILLFKFIAVVGAIHAIIGLLQLSNIAFLDIPGSPMQPIGLMANSNLFGSAQALSLVFIIYLILSNAVKNKFTLRLIAVIVLCSVWFSNCRSAILTSSILILGVCIVGLFFLPSLRNFFKKLLISFLMLISLLILIVLTFKNETEIFKRLERKINITAYNKNPLITSTIDDRFQIWNATIKLIKQNPFLGIGAGNWRLGAYGYTAEVDGWKAGKYSPDKAHNIILQLLSEVGIVGLLLFLFIFGYLIKCGFKNIFTAKDEDNKLHSITVLLGLIVFIIDANFSFPFDRIEHNIYLSLIIACILKLNKTNEVIEIANSQTKKTFITSALALAIISSVYFGYSKYRFDKDLSIASLSLSDGNALDAISILDNNNDGIIKYTGEKLFTIAYLKANAFFNLKKYNEANKAIEEALKLHPNNTELLNLKGSILSNDKKFDEALIYYKQAQQLLPSQLEVSKNIAYHYFLLQKFDSCKYEIKNKNLSTDAFFKDLLLKMDSLKK